MSLRVIAGSVGGRKLVAPKGGARPTTDRVKEALFASLGAALIDGAAVLDLYAGSGALAIEALSRGASRAVLVDHDRAAVVAMEANLATTGFTEVAQIARAPVAAFLRDGGGPFDLVFLDPPYDTPSTEVSAVLADLADRRIVAPGGTVVVERPKSGEPLVLPDPWKSEKERGYGDTLLVVAHAR